MLINPDTIRTALTDAPAWALIGLTMPSDRLRADAERELATHLYERLCTSSAAETQLPLPL